MAELASTDLDLLPRSDFDATMRLVRRAIDEGQALSLPRSEVAQIVERMVSVRDRIQRKHKPLNIQGSWVTVLLGGVGLYTALAQLAYGPVLAAAAVLVAVILRIVVQQADRWMDRAKEIDSAAGDLRKQLEKLPAEVSGTGLRFPEYIDRLEESVAEAEAEEEAALVDGEPRRPDPHMLPSPPKPLPPVAAAASQGPKASPKEADRSQPKGRKKGKRR